MGFLSHYEGTKRVPLDDGYWIDVKLCLSEAEREGGQEALVAAVAARQSTSSDVDLTLYRRCFLAASILAWNLDDDDGTVWALEPDEVKMDNILRLPGPVFTTVWRVVDGLNSPDKAERARFRDSGVGGDPDGPAGAAEPAGLRPGPDVVEGTGPAPGGSDGVADPQD